MSQENKKIIEDVNSLLVNGSSTQYDVSVNEDRILKVWIKELSFLDSQKALKEVVNISQGGDVEIDLAGYWRYMLTECVERPEPQLSKAQLFALKPDVAGKITELMPQPQDLLVGPLAAGLEG